MPPLLLLLCCLAFVVTPSNTQELLDPVRARSNYSWQCLGKPYGVPGMEPGLAPCKVSSGPSKFHRLEEAMTLGQPQVTSGQGRG